MRLAIAALSLPLILAPQAKAVTEIHVEHEFHISRSGDLVNFPEEYGPASLKVVYGSKAHPERKPQVTVVVGSRKTELSACLAHLFMQPTRLSIRAHAIFSTSPPYLQFDLPYREGDSNAFDGYSFRFNVRSGELIWVRKHELKADGLSPRLLSEAQACDEDLFGFAEPAR
jgi:hypothetical protein